MKRSHEPAAVTDLLERVARLVQSYLHAEGLPPAQWQAMDYLASANRFSRTPTAIGRYLDATKGTVSQTIMALVRKGLVSKKPDPADRRSVSLRLTARGEALLARHPLTEITAVVAALPSDARHALGAGLARLLDEMLAKRSGRAFGQCASCRFFQSNASPGAQGGPHRCRLLDVALSDDDAAKICVEYEHAA